MPLYRLQSLRRQLGISLLEILLGLCIISVILAVTLRYFQATNQNMRVTQTINQIHRLTQVSYDWLSMQRMVDFSSGDSISVSQLLNAGMITTADVQSAWGSKITLSAGIDNPSHVRITIPSIPTVACSDLSQRLNTIAYKEVSIGDCSDNTFFGEF